MSNPVLGIGGSNGLVPVPGRFTPVAHRAARCFLDRAFAAEHPDVQVRRRGR